MWLTQESEADMKAEDTDDIMGAPGSAIPEASPALEVSKL